MEQEKWKPTPAHLEALEFVIRDYREDGCDTTANYLQEIYEHIKDSMKSTDWDAIAERYEKSKKALEYMAEHPLTHDEAVAQTQRLFNQSNLDNR